MERHAIDDRIYTATSKGGKVSSLALFYGKAVSVAENLPTVFLGQDNFSYGRNSDSKAHLLKKKHLMCIFISSENVYSLKYLWHFITTLWYKWLEKRRY